MTNLVKIVVAQLLPYINTEGFSSGSLGFSSSDKKQKTKKDLWIQIQSARSGQRVHQL